MRELFLFLAGAAIWHLGYELIKIRRRRANRRYGDIHIRLLKGVIRRSFVPDSDGVYRFSIGKDVPLNGISEGQFGGSRWNKPADSSSATKERDIPTK